MSEAELSKIQMTEYQAGKSAFERGEYRLAVSHLLVAVTQVQSNTRAGGEVQVWLVTALEANGQISEATALCQKLLSHPNLETRQATKRLFYIMQAPALLRRDEWLTKIPDLTHLEDREGNAGINYQPTPLPKPKVRSLEERYAPIDLSQVETKDNNFSSIALILTIVTLFGLWFAAGF
jgi:hypothetical protein